MYTNSLRCSARITRYVRMTCVQRIQSYPNVLLSSRQLRASPINLSQPLTCISSCREYSACTDSELAKEILMNYHQKTVDKYGQHGSRHSSHGEATESKQFRALPAFLKDAQKLNERAYFCHTNKNGTRELRRFSRGENIILSTEGLGSLSQVRDIATSGKYVAILVSSDEESNIFIAEERSGEVVRRLAAGHQIQWTSDTQLFYTSINDNLRPDTVFFVDLATQKQVLVYESVKEDEVVSVTTTKDRKFTAVNLSTKLTSHVHLLGEGELTCSPENVICPRNTGIKCYLEHMSSKLLAVMTSVEFPNLSLYQSEAIDQSEGRYPDISTFTRHPGDFGVIHEIEVFREGLVVYHSPLDASGNRCNYRLTLLDPHDYTVTKAAIDFPADVCLISPNGNNSSSQAHLRVSVHSYTKPVKQMSIPFLKFAVSPGRLITQGRYALRKEVVNSSGVDIPITIIGKERVVDSCGPALFLVYGCYGESLVYWLELLPRELLDVGWKVVLCHVRGGGELGHSWYTQGVGVNKHVSIADTIATIKHLHSLNLTSPAQSVLHATSSGALVAARALQSHPGIVSKLVLRLPFLDRKAQGPLFHEEREEWGELHASTGGDLGAEVFLTVADRDRRAPPWHAANFLSSLSSTKHCYVNFISAADHSGFDDEAYQLETSFILDQSRLRNIWSLFRR